jgi:nicotinate phosphoribosyltransferase
MASGDLDEKIIADLLKNNSPIDIFGVGTELATSRDDPAMNGVYKLVAIKTPISKNKYKMTYKLKTSPGKKTYPAPKQVYRIFSDGIIQQDIIGLDDEKFNHVKTVPLLKKVMNRGKILSKLPSLDKIRDFHIAQRDTLPREFRMFDKIPTSFPVSYSVKLETIAREFKPQ